MTASVPPDLTEHAPVRRLAIQAHIMYIGDGGDGGDWCCEAGSSGEDGEFWPGVQGWGPDALAAALDCAENAYARSLMLEGIKIVPPDRRGRDSLTWSERPIVAALEVPE